MNLYDAAVIGSGPAGVTAALYLARSGCSVLLVEQLAAGGQLLMTDALENYPGYPKGVKGYELADLFTAHLDGLAVDRVTGTVQALTGEAGHFAMTVDGQEHACKTVLVCAGARHRKLGLDDEDRLLGHGVSYCALCDGNFFRGQTVAVVGGGNAALEETLYLAKIVGKVFLIHRRDAFRGLKTYVDKLAAMPDKVELVLESVVTRLHGESDLTGLTVRHVHSGAERHLSLDGLFVYAGFEPETGFVPPALQRDDHGFIVTDTEMRTSIPGIFAAGDIRSKLCRQVITAAGDGATAAQAAFVFLEQLHA